MQDATATPRILIADDAFDSRQLLVRMLRSLTHADLHEVRDGEAAVREFEAMRPAITLLDVEMPLLDGMAALERIRESDPEAFVVIVSGNGRLETVQRAMSLGVGGFIVKPYSEQRVAAVLNTYAARTGNHALLRA